MFELRQLSHSLNKLRDVHFLTHDSSALGEMIECSNETDKGGELLLKYDMLLCPLVAYFMFYWVTSLVFPSSQIRPLIAFQTKMSHNILRIYQYEVITLSFLKKQMR